MISVWFFLSCSLKPLETSGRIVQLLSVNVKFIRTTHSWNTTVQLLSVNAFICDIITTHLFGTWRYHLLQTPAPEQSWQPHSSESSISYVTMCDIIISHLTFSVIYYTHMFLNSHGSPMVLCHQFYVTTCDFVICNATNLHAAFSVTTHTCAWAVIVGPWFLVIQFICDHVCHCHVTLDTTQLSTTHTYSWAIMAAP